jgi:hypothetical protein
MDLTEIVCVMDGSAYCVKWWALVSHGAGSGVGTRQVIAKLYIRAVGVRWTELTWIASFGWLWY